MRFASLCRVSHASRTLTTQSVSPGTTSTLPISPSRDPRWLQSVNQAFVSLAILCLPLSMSPVLPEAFSYADFLLHSFPSTSNISFFPHLDLPVAARLQRTGHCYVFFGALLPSAWERRQRCLISSACSAYRQRHVGHAPSQSHLPRGVACKCLTGCPSWSPACLAPYINTHAAS